MVKNLLAVQETQVWSLSQEDPLEKGMTTHSSILSWRIPWTEEPGGLQSTGSQRIRQDWMTLTSTSSVISIIHQFNIQFIKISLSLLWVASLAKQLVDHSCWMHQERALSCGRQSIWEFLIENNPMWFHVVFGFLLLLFWEWTVEGASLVLQGLNPLGINDTLVVSIKPKNAIWSYFIYFPLSFSKLSILNINNDRSSRSKLWNTLALTPIREAVLNIATWQPHDGWILSDLLASWTTRTVFFFFFGFTMWHAGSQFLD